MSDFSDFPGPLISERVDVKELKNRLEKLNWDNGARHGLTEHMLLGDFIYDAIFEQRFNELNKELLEDLTDEERGEVLDYIKGILKNYPEDSLLNCLKYGVEYTLKRREKRIYRIIDFERPDNNSFIYAGEIKYPGSPDNVKPDITLFVNGIPIAIIEAKPSTRIGSEQEAIDQIRRYEQESPELFRYVQLAIAYGHRKLFLPTYPNWNREPRLTPAQSWKVERGEGESAYKEESVESLLQPATLLKVIKWFTFFREQDKRIDKIIGRYNQYSATEKALERISGYLNGQEKIGTGLIWHWQGSGKTYTMFYIANRYFEEYFRRSPLIFFVVDRVDLQRQLRDFLKGLKAPKFQSYLKIIEDIDQLKREIATIKRSEYQRGVVARGIYIVLIQKFKKKDFEDLLQGLAQEQMEFIRQTDRNEYEKMRAELESLSQDEKIRRLMELGSIRKREILLLIDEAHRSQYGLLASMMKNVFPNAMRFAFTGTPVFKFERNTFLEFASPPKEYYLDVYFIRDSIEDGFTLPIVYDVIQEGKPAAEGVKILLNDADIKKYIDYWQHISEQEQGSPADDMESFMETGAPLELPPQNFKLTRREIDQHLSKVRVFLTNEKRLQKLAQHIAQRVQDDTENFRFKAMVVVANREACVHMKRFLDSELQSLYPDRNDVRKWTEIVMTYQHNDRGVILEYKDQITRERGKSDTNEISADIQREFKTEENPKILIVTDMLITGFDVPKLKVMYLDKPLYEHRLLQAIARVNRPYRDEIGEKRYGLIVDSIGLLKYVRESIEKYGLIADKRIASDIEDNALGTIESRVEEFKRNLNGLKQIMKTLTIDGRDLSIDVDELKMELKASKERALETIRETVDPKAKIMAAFRSTLEMQNLLNMMKETLGQFEALGSHRERIYYVEDIQILSYIYGMVFYFIKGKKVPQEFWEGLIELIHEKTLVEEFRTLMKAEMSNEMLKSTLQKAWKEISAKEIIHDSNVADAYRILSQLLEMDLANPIYREIKERIEAAREEWINRNIDTPTFLSILTESNDKRLNYEEDIASKPLIQRITETVNLLANEKFAGKKEPQLKLENLKKEIPEVMKAAKIVEPHKRKLVTALMRDLFREIKEGELNRITSFAENAVETYIIKEIEKARNTGGLAS